MDGKVPVRLSFIMVIKVLFPEACCGIIPSRYLLTAVDEFTRLLNGKAWGKCPIQEINMPFLIYLLGKEIPVTQQKSGNVIFYGDIACFAI